MTHLTPEQLLDVADGTEPHSRYPHLEACGFCGRQVEELRATIAAASRVEVPEPSPLFWDHFAARVREAVAAEPARRAPRLAPWAAWSLGVAAAAALVVLVGITVAPREPAAPPAAAGVMAVDPAAAPDLRAFDDDPAFTLLADLSSDLDWESASAAGFVVAPGAADRIVLALDAEERTALQRILEEELAAGGA
jgi:hypothetical protein